MLFVDDDFDGVEDTQDRCLNTPFMDLVDNSGCSITSLVSEHNFDVIAGLAYSSKDETTLQGEQTFYATLQMDYNFKNFNFYAIVSSYQNDYSSGLDDTLAGGAYTFNLFDYFSLSPGLTLFFPTYDSGLDNEEIDVATSLSFEVHYKDFLLLGAYSYTFINDTDTADIKYQNTSAYQLGIGYIATANMYMDIGFYKSSSIYQDVDDLQSVLFDMNYYIDDKYFVLLNYSHGLSETANDNYLSLQFGRNF